MRVSAAGVRFAAFAKTYMRQTKGRWAGRPLLLENWQILAMSEALRTEPTSWCNAPADNPWPAFERFLASDKARERPGTRVYREAYFQLAKKNGKSTMAAAAALYFLLADGEMGGEVYSAATTVRQAKIVFSQAKEAVQASPLLRDWVEVYADELRVPDTNSVYRALSADAPGHEGLNPSAIIIDELHRFDNRDLYDTLTSGDVARLQPFTLVITNAGVDPESICHEVYQQGRDAAAGLPDSRQDLYFYAPSVPEERLDDRRRWKDANPASWITMETLERNYRKYPLAVFARRHLNVWTAVEHEWLPPFAWENCAQEDAQIPEGEPVWVGVDLGLKHDTAAVGWAWPEDEGDPETRIFVDAHVWGLHADPDQDPPPAHEIVRDVRLPIADVEEFLLRQIAGEWDLRELAYDPWRFERSAQMLDEEGIEVTEFLQIDSYMVPATQLLYEGIVNGRIVHRGDPIIAKHVHAAATQSGTRGYRLAKRRAKRPMDALIAMLLAVARCQASIDAQAGERPSVTAI